MALAQLDPADLQISEDLRKILVELNAGFFERRDVLEAMMRAILAAQHVFLLGEPGTGKSMMARALCERFLSALYWEILLDKQLPMDSVFGPWDIAEFDKSGAWHRRIDGYAATCHIAFLDEIGKSGPSVTNPLLTWLNERLFHNNSKPMRTPLISAITASNEELEFPEQAALHDRFLVRRQVMGIQEPGNFAALLGTAVHSGATATPTTITLQQLEHVVYDVVPKIVVPPGVIDSILQLRSDLRGIDVTPSDRRWKQSIRIMQASAFLEGRGAVDDDDLQVQRDIMWDVVEQIPAVEKKVLALTSPLTRKALEFQGQLEEVEEGIDSRKGQAVETRAAYGGEAKYKVDKIQGALNDLIEKANRQGRSTTRLQGILDQAKALKVRIFVECLNVPQDRAEKMDQ